MSERDWLFRLEDILECARRVVTYAARLDRDAFAANRMATDAIVHNLLIMGEAASRMPDDARLRLAHLPWQQMRGMRNRLIHDYPSVDLDIVWETVCSDIPALIPHLEAAIAGERDRRDRIKNDS